MVLHGISFSLWRSEFLGVIAKLLQRSTLLKLLASSYPPDGWAWIAGHKAAPSMTQAAGSTC